MLSSLSCPCKPLEIDVHVLLFDSADDEFFMLTQDPRAVPYPHEGQVIVHVEKTEEGIVAKIWARVYGEAREFLHGIRLKKKKKKKKKRMSEKNSSLKNAFG